MNDNTALPAPMSPRKEAIRTLHDELAPERMRWLESGAFFHEEDLRYLKFLIPESLRISRARLRKRTIARGAQPFVRRGRGFQRRNASGSQAQLPASVVYRG